MKSEASKKLEEYARRMDNTYDDFIAFMGRSPQRHGVDEALLRFIEENPDCTHDEIIDRYAVLALLK